MTSAFQMFDPYAFLDEEKAEACRQSDGATALAELASLAARQQAQPISPQQASDGPSSFATLAALAGSPARTHEASRPADDSKAAKPAQAAKAGARPASIQLWADGVAHLDSDRPPHDVPAQRWRQFIYDAARFIDNGFAEQAAALGWDEYDLFAFDQDRPLARLDQAGLVWLLHGDRVIALSDNVATIQTRSGARQTWHRRPRQPGRVLAWQFH